MSARWAALAIPLALVGCATRGSVTRVGEAAGSAECAAGHYVDRAFREVAVKKGVVYSRPSDSYGVHELRMDVYWLVQDLPLLSSFHCPKGRYKGNQPEEYNS